MAFINYMQRRGRGREGKERLAGWRGWGGGDKGLLINIQSKPLVTMVTRKGLKIDAIFSITSFRLEIAGSRTRLYYLFNFSI